MGAVNRSTPQTSDSLEQMSSNAHDIHVSSRRSAVQLFRRPSSLLGAADSAQWAALELSHRLPPHFSDRLGQCELLRTVVPGGTRFGDACREDWTLARPQNAVRQEQKQMAIIKYHQTSARGWLHLSTVSFSLF